MTLVQRKWTERRSFTIAENGLEIEEKTLFSRLRYCVPFEAIPDDTFSVASSSRVWFALAILAAAAIALHVAAVAPALMFAFLWWQSRRAYVGLRCGRQLVLFHDRSPLPEFLDDLQLRKRLYLRREYTRELELPDVAQA